jgi:cell division initiation protein
MVGRIKELESQLDKMNDKLKHYERVEEALHETLQTAKNSAEEKLSSARKESKMIIEKAEMEADSIVHDANRQKQEIRQTIHHLIDRREQIIRTIQSYLENTQKSLEVFDNTEPSLFSLSEEEPKENAPKSEHSEESEQNRSDQKYMGQAGVPGAENIEKIIDDLD